MRLCAKEGHDIPGGIEKMCTDARTTMMTLDTWPTPGLTLREALELAARAGVRLSLILSLRHEACSINAKVVA